MESQLTFWRAIGLAVIQGATEFIPVSSSGHLVLARKLFGWSDTGGLVFDTILHAGSLAALLIYFRQELISVLTRISHRQTASVQNPLARQELAASDFAWYRRLPWLIVVATLPVVIAGPILKPFLETEYTVRNSAITGMCMIMTAFLFWLADLRFAPKGKPIGFFHALFIGCMQVVALLPGASRSGWTFGAGILCGHTRESAVRFSFLMAIPAIAGAVIFQIRDIIAQSHAEFQPYMIVAGFIVSFLVSLGAIHFCLIYFRTHSLRIFSIYLAVTGLLAVLL